MEISSLFQIYLVVLCNTLLYDIFAKRVKTIDLDLPQIGAKAVFDVIHFLVRFYHLILLMYLRSLCHSLNFLLVLRRTSISSHAN